MAKPKRVKDRLASALLVSMGASIIDDLIDHELSKLPKRRIKKCLVCGKEHTHNNSFCSPECCKADKER
jgi:hypothetical protein